MVKDKVPDKNAIKAVTNNMVDVLSKSSNPKHRNSKFLKFLLKLNHGTYTLDEENKTLIKHPEMKEDFQKFY